MRRNLQTMKKTDGNAMERKVLKAIEMEGFQEDWEVIPRNYGYEVKLYGAMGCESTNIAWSLSQIIGYGEYPVIPRKTYESIKCYL